MSKDDRRDWAARGSAGDRDDGPRGPAPSGWEAPGSSSIRRLVCVAANASIDKTAAVERLVPGGIHRPEILAVVPGGKALNVVRSARGLGMAASVVAVLGGHAGSWIEEALAARGIRARVVRLPGETRTCLSVLDRATGLLTEFYEAGTPLDMAGWQSLEAALAAELAADPAGTLVAISGSLPPGAPSDGYRRLAVLASDRAARVILDASGAQLAAALSARPWLVKVNAAEAADATAVPTPDEAGTVAAARALRARGAGAAIVTRGAAGAVVVDGEGAAWRLGPPPEQGRYAVGSGDAFLAGTAAALAGGTALPEAARRGAAAACANALVPGQGELDPVEAARLLPRIRLQRLDPER